jgi:hypothetical protein
MTVETRERLWTRRGGYEVVANLLAIGLIPLIARVLWPRFENGFTTFGFAEIVEKLAGNGGWTDVGWEVASSLGLVRGDYSAYDSLEKLHPLIGMKLDFVDLSVHSHPPMAIPLTIPLTWVDYGWWLSFWVVASVCAIALSMRLLRVPAHIAYPLAIGIALTIPGRWGLVSTYPISALLIALAWRYRRHPWISGSALGIYGATRGIGLLMLAYPLVRRQWRTVIIGVGVVAGLLALAVALEPSVIQEFLTTSRASIEASMQRLDLVTPGSLLRRRGFSEYAAWIIAAVVAAVALWRKQELFWVLNWFIMAISPIAWFHTVIMAIPLMVVIWKSGKLGQVLVLLIGATVVSPAPLVSTFWSIDWIAMVVLSGIALLFCRIPSEPWSKTRQLTPTV